MPFASSVEVTNGGIAESHNGIPIRPITFRGTTGVLPGRGSGSVLTTPNLAQSIFAGTINAAIGTAQTAASIVAPASGTNLVTDAELQADLKGTTGYFQFLLLQNFLERYAHLKAKKAGADYRLAFCIWKTKEIYLVTPVSFELTRDAQRPLRFDYSFSMKAWRRITLDQTVVEDTRRSVSRDPGLMQAILTRIDAARRTLYGVQATLEAAVRDVQSAVMEPLRSVSLLLKDSLGFGLAVADLSENIIRDLRDISLESIAALPELAEFRDELEALRSFSVSTGKAETKAGTLRTIAASAPDPGNKILENPRQHLLMFSYINVGSLNLSPADHEEDRGRAGARAPADPP
jgi:hypothetical protein